MRRLSRRAGRGWEALLESREGSGGILSPPRRVERVGRPTRRARRSQEALPEFREGSEGPPGGTGGPP